MRANKKGGAYISVSENYELVSYNDIEKGLADNDVSEKERNQRLLITNILNNECYPQMILNVINNIIPYVNKSITMKKMLFLYWEIVDKMDEDGKLKEEFILICNNFRNDLIHANEYIAGRALKLLSNMMVKEIMDPLIDTILDKCLNHQDQYVRRYAVLCLQRIWESFGDSALSDFEEKLEKFLMKETDLTSRRNAYQLIFEVNKEKALKMVFDSIKDGDIENFGDILQLVIVQMLRKTAKSDPKLAGRAIKYIKHFANSKFISVLYETAISLISLTNNPDTLRISMGILQQMLKGNSDNNVKLQILDQLEYLRKLNPRLLEESFSDLVIILKSDSVDLKIRFLKFLELFLNSNNIIKIIGTLQSELVNSCKDKSALSQKYQAKILSIIHRYLVLKVIPPMDIVQHTLPGLLSCEIKSKSSFDLLRSIINYLIFNEGPEVRNCITLLFLESLLTIEDKDLMVSAIYHLGKYLDTQKLVSEFIFKIKSSAGPYPFELKDKRDGMYKKKGEEEETVEEQVPQKKYITKTVIKSDGTYGEELVEVVEDEKDKNGANDDGLIFHKLRTWLMKSEVFALGVVRALVRGLCVLDYTETVSKKTVADVLIFLCQLVQFYQKVDRSIDAAFFKNMSDIIRQLTNKDNYNKGKLNIENINDVQDPEDFQLGAENEIVLESQNNEETAEAQVDEMIFFRQLQSKSEVDVDAEGIFAGTGINFEETEEKDNYIEKLAKLVQLTGTSDPIYIEAFVHQNRFDTYLELILINRTDEIFKNLTISFFAVGDSENANKTLDSIDNVLLKSGCTQHLYKTLKITPKDAMYIAGNLTFENTRGEIVRNNMTSEISLEILDLIYPATISNYEFRTLWQKYNWENRIEVNTPFDDPVEFVTHLCNELKISVVERLTPFSDNKYLSANLYAKTYMGCDFLLNLSIEKDSGTLKGHIRIRSEQKMVVVNIYKHLRQIQATKPKTKDVTTTE